MDNERMGGSGDDYQPIGNELTSHGSQDAAFREARGVRERQINDKRAPRFTGKGIYASWMGMPLNLHLRARTVAGTKAECKVDFRRSYVRQ